MSRVILEKLREGTVRAVLLETQPDTGAYVVERILERDSSTRELLIWLWEEGYIKRPADTVALWKSGIRLTESVDDMPAEMGAQVRHDNEERIERLEEELKLLMHRVAEVSLEIDVLRGSL